LATEMKHVSHASQTQSRDVHAINLALTSLDTDTQGNAALVEEISAAAQMLRKQSNGLRNLVASFNLQGDGEANIASTPLNATELEADDQAIA
jgi:methyl-accepting chemotaxis protein